MMEKIKTVKQMNDDFFEQSKDSISSSDFSKAKKVFKEKIINFTQMVNKGLVSKLKEVEE